MNIVQLVQKNKKRSCWWDRADHTYLFTVSNGSLLLMPFGGFDPKSKYKTKYGIIKPVYQTKQTKYESIL